MYQPRVFLYRSSAAAPVCTFICVSVVKDFICSLRFVVGFKNDVMMKSHNVKNERQSLPAKIMNKIQYSVNDEES